MKRSHITWEQAFKECNDSHARHALEMSVTNDLFPRDDGELWTDWIGLNQESRDLVYQVISERAK